MSLTKKVEEDGKKAINNCDGEYVLLEDSHYPGILIGRVENVGNFNVDYILHPLGGGKIFLEYHDVRKVEILKQTPNTFGDMKRLD